MDPDRRYISVILKNNKVFNDKIDSKYKTTKRLSKDKIKENILKVINEEPVSLNELSKRLNYKGISKSLTIAVKELEEDSYLKQIKNGRTSIIKITSFGKKHIK